MRGTDGGEVVKGGEKCCDGIVGAIGKLFGGFSNIIAQKLAAVPCKAYVNNIWYNVVYHKCHVARQE